MRSWLGVTLTATKRTDGGGEEEEEEAVQSIWSSTIAAVSRLVFGVGGHSSSSESEREEWDRQRRLEAWEGRSSSSEERSLRLATDGLYGAME